MILAWYHYIKEEKKGEKNDRDYDFGFTYNATL